MANLIFKEEIYKIIAAIYEVYNELGFGYREKHYQKAAYRELIDRGFKVEKEFTSFTKYKGYPLARYSLDFLIDGKIVVELKVADDFYKSHISQILSYLKSTGLKLGVLVIITPKGIRFKRVIN